LADAIDTLEVNGKICLIRSFIDSCKTYLTSTYPSWYTKQ